MRKRWRLIIGGSCVGALLAASLPAAATHGLDGHSQNMKHLSNVARSSNRQQSDLAFKGRLAFAGNYNGFRVIDISDPEAPVVVKDVWCPGPQHDVSVWGDALVLSVDSVMLRNGSRAGSDPWDCDASEAPASQVTREDGWEGLRVFSLSQVMSATPGTDGFVRGLDPVAGIYTDCGSHTHTGVPVGDKVLAYVASYPLRSGPDCGPHDDATDDHDPLHKKISIAEIDPANPAASGFLKEVPIDVPTWSIYDLAPTLPAGFNPMQGCHDVQVDMSLDLAAAACSSVGQVWDISDPANPQTMTPEWEVDEGDVQFYHSALFSEDEETVIFGDEIIAGSCDDGTGSGQLWFHDIDDGATHSSFQIPRTQPGQYCSAHLFNNIPGIARDVLVSSWYGGGTTVIDYTDPANPKEIAYYDPAESANTQTRAWASYWYNGLIYANDGASTRSRGFDVFLLSDKVRAGATRFGGLNPQTQY